ncbi:hypothetical protein [Brevifollis gellanilyticus]|uniref:Lactococcin 972 family bacteriocin n=1 Tax=Brevifollis gellanilyticus TaxID=748831 RepID=A0A512M3D7_9BACT|nr:hypothetical protein [Brevifollis gellanilyticus]GEP41250.1 hypothetical protein BGE01nite_05410 [Brevifollis gellanilyticus]
MKHTLITMAGLLTLSVTGSALAGTGSYGSYPATSSSGTKWRYTVDSHAWSGVPETDARRTGQVTQWNISNPRTASRRGR